MTSTQQLHRNDQNRGEYSTPDAHLSETSQDPAATAAQSRGLGGGTDVMGEAVNPTSQVNEQGFAGDTSKYGGSYPTSGGSYASVPSSAGPQTPSKPPPAYSATPSSTAVPGQSTSSAHQSSTANAQTPYVHTSSIPGGTAKTPMDSVMHVFNKWSKKAEDMTGNVWNHLKTGPNVADTAMGRIAIGTKAMSEGGLENVFRQTFEVAPEEHLLKSFACYLSTSTGPVAGTLYLSTNNLAFCSDRPLAIPGSSDPAAKHTPPTNNPSAAKTTRAGTTHNTSAAQQQQQWVFYKLMVPISQLEAVNPTENVQKKPPERFVQVKTVDGHEFWFLGFVNYDKGVKNLQETLSLAKSTNASGTTNAPHTTINATPSSNIYSDPPSTATNASHHGVD